VTCAAAILAEPPHEGRIAEVPVDNGVTEKQIDEQGTEMLDKPSNEPLQTTAKPAN
jgi:hypothetical protein